MLCSWAYGDQDPFVSRGRTLPGRNDYLRMRTRIQTTLFALDCRQDVDCVRQRSDLLMETVTSSKVEERSRFSQARRGSFGSPYWFKAVIHADVTLGIPGVVVQAGRCTVGQRSEQSRQQAVGIYIMGVECMLLVREPCVLLGITRCGHATIGEANGEVGARVPADQCGSSALIPG
ncbi:hypothetical protein CPB85DRAFT_1328226, partial [Mucidula mucida]